MACTGIARNACLMRSARKWWMRMLPSSAHYACTHCEQQAFLVSARPHERACQPD